MTDFDTGRPRRWTSDSSAIQTKREGELASLLARTLHAFARTVELHDGCESCAVDVSIFTRRAAELGVEVKER